MPERKMTEQEEAWFDDLQALLKRKPPTITLKMEGQTIVVIDSYLLNTGM